MISFEGRTTVITGAAGGIGLATAELFARYGANLLLADVDAEGVAAIARRLDPGGRRVAHGRLDVTSRDACAQQLAEAARRFGGIDHVVHSAGVYPEALVKDESEQGWRRLMAINLDGTFHVCQAAMPHLREGSAVVLLASMAARGSFGHAAYAASKAAVLGFTRSLALELAPRTRVNAVSPGIILTRMTDGLLAQRGPQLLAGTPLGRHGRPEECAGVIAFLCSPLASFVTGENVHVNGGLYMA